MENQNTNYVYGRNAVAELLKAGKRSVNKILVSKTAHGKPINDIIALARDKRVPVHFTPPEKFDAISEYSQGVAAEVSAREYVELDQLIKNAQSVKKPVIVILDGIEDPHNTGAIIRNAVAFGAQGVIIPKWRAAALNETVSKASAGAVEHIDIARVTNLMQAIDALKESGFWVAGLEREGDPFSGKTKIVFPLALVIGSEGSGVSALVKKNCDFLLSIPQTNFVSSLNASCAAAVSLYEISKNK
jgi:23S rRNA (guanosine2251-2'-O)-methyltransferase